MSKSILFLLEYFQTYIDVKFILNEKGGHINTTHNFKKFLIYESCKYVLKKD